MPALPGGVSVLRYFGDGGGPPRRARGLQEPEVRFQKMRDSSLYPVWRDKACHRGDKACHAGRKFDGLEARGEKVLKVSALPGNRETYSAAQPGKAAAK